jgi:type II secretory pathway pseudopilin PulG
MIRRKAFTLAELLVVMGIIVLFIAMAVPAVRSITGSSNNSVSRNQLAALVARAREEAVGVQSVRGVLFFIDPNSDRMVGIICQQAAIQDPALAAYNVVLLDAVPQRDSLMLPVGIRLQTIFNGTNDRYLGFNPIGPSAFPVKVGGCILFDGNGKLISRPYGFQMAQVASTFTPTTLASMLFGATYAPSASSGTGILSDSVPYGSGNVTSYSYVPGVASTSGLASAVFPLSQLGFVLFDYDTFKNQGFSDVDADINAQGYSSAPMTVGTTSQTASEQTEESWLDQNSTPLMVNRYNGTLIRGE